MKKCLRIFFIIMISIIGQCPSSEGQCLTLAGTLVDVSTQKNIQEATFYSVFGKRRKQLGKISDGKFELSISCNAEFLSVESPNYRPTLLRLNLDSQNPSQRVFAYLKIQLVGVDLQTTDKPYFQQEQKHFELSASVKNRDKKPFASRVFKVVDAINKEPINASLCLNYTKTNQRNCFELSNKQSKEVTFNEQDIVALEVNSPSYQNYNGNVIIDQLDDKQKVYEIKLAKELTIFSIDIANQDDSFSCLLKSKSGKEFLMNGLKENKFYTYLSPDTYQLIVQTANKEVVFEKNVKIKLGLNTEFIKIKKKVEAPIQQVVQPNDVVNKEEKIEEKPMTIGNKITLFFEQSDYRLRPESEKYLRELTEILKKKETALLRIVGFTDDVGMNKKNVVLSEFRSIVIKNYLVQHGIDEARIINIGVWE